MPKGRADNADTLCCGCGYTEDLLQLLLIIH
jgi:hypothetical protein